MEQGYIYIHDSIFSTLLAISAEEQARGLMEQDWPPPIMSFIYAKPSINRFWMSNTPSPLDIVFCHNGEVTQICKGEPYSTKMIGDHMFSDLIIEFPSGTVKSSGIKLKHKVGLVKPTTEELKRIIAEKYSGIIKN
jgi:uncharacterized membrane protein (UPF0127 family)